MAWTRKLPSGKHQGMYRDVAGKPRSAGTFPHKPAALRAAGAAEVASRKAGFRDPNSARMTWGDWCDEWWPSRGVESSTLRTDVGRRDKHLKPRWESIALGDITRQDVRAWASDMRAAGVGASTVQRIVALFSASLSAAIDAEILSVNPSARLRLSTPAQGVERYLTRDETAAVLAELDGMSRRAVLVLLATGMRWGEACGLHWSRVDLDREVIQVAEVWVPEAKTMKAYPKGRRIRQVPVPEWLLTELGKKPGAGSCGYPHTSGICRSQLVLTSPGGAVMDGSAMRKAWASAVERAKIPHARLHDLRHTYASWLVQDGVPLAEVGRLLGHVSPMTTQRYAHLGETRTDHVLAALPDPATRAANVQQHAAK